MIKSVVMWLHIVVESLLMYVCRTVRESTHLYAPGECILDENDSACFIFEPVEIIEKNVDAN
jgi:hypothetical protein